MRALDGGVPRYAPRLPIPPAHYRPIQLRCGLCDEPFKRGDRTVRVDDERCHRECAEDE